MRRARRARTAPRLRRSRPAPSARTPAGVPRRARSPARRRTRPAPGPDAHQPDPLDRRRAERGVREQREVGVGVVEREVGGESSGGGVVGTTCRRRDLTRRARADVRRSIAAENSGSNRAASQVGHGAVDRPALLDPSRAHGLPQPHAQRADPDHGPTGVPEAHAPRRPSVHSQSSPRRRRLSVDLPFEVEELGRVEEDAGRVGPGAPRQAEPGRGALEPGRVPDRLDVPHARRWRPELGAVAGRPHVLGRRAGAWSSTKHAAVGLDGAAEPPHVRPDARPDAHEAGRQPLAVRRDDGLDPRRRRRPGPPRRRGGGPRRAPGSRRQPRALSVSENARGRYRASRTRKVTAIAARPEHLGQLDPDQAPPTTTARSTPAVDASIRSRSARW